MDADLLTAVAPLATRQPIVNVRDGEVFANSRDVAAFFDKAHRNVLEGIDNLLKQEPDLALRSFRQGVYLLAETGAQQHRCFDMDRRGFTLLAMGFTGAKALKWKLRYIDAFDAMEAQLRKPQFVVDPSDPKVMLAVFAHLQAAVAEKDVKIAAQGEKLKVLDRLEGSEGSMCISSAAKTLGVNPIRHLFARLQAEGWIFKRPGNGTWLAYQDKIQAGFLEHEDHHFLDDQGRDRVATRALVTAKGLVRIAEILTKALH